MKQHYTHPEASILILQMETSILSTASTAQPGGEADMVINQLDNDIW